MTANITAYLHKGSKLINLNGSAYNLGSDFVPPAENQTFNVAGGSSANRVNGGEAVSSARQDREWRFKVQVLGTSSMQINASVQALVNLVAQWDDDAEPLYLEYKGHTLPEPLWGQFGALRRYQVVWGAVEGIGNYYTIGNTRDKFTEVILSLRVKPLALGIQQRLATASGGVLEDVLGMADGVSRGLKVFEATTNKMTNPVFGSATWDTGWSANANVISAKNTDPDFVYPGAKVSARLTNKGSGSTVFYQTINVGNTNAHYLTAYVVKHDRSAVTVADCRLYYGALATQTITSIGNGVYMLSAPVTGIASATATGVSVLAKSTIYLLGMQLEEKAYPTPLCWGDQLGCAWTSTAHGSTSTRTAGRVTIPTTEVFHSGQGTIAWAVKMPLVSTLQPTWVFWDMAGVDFRSYWQLSDAKFYFDDDTNVIASAATSFAAGDVLHFHATWNNAGLKLYLNGAEVATGATYTTPTIGATFDIGRDNAGNPGGGTIMGWTAYDIAMTAAQVLAHYTAAAAVTSSDRRTDWIPWLWTKDGDNIVDVNTDASGGLSAPNANYSVVSGIPGNIEALTRYLMLPSTVNIKRVYLNRVLLDAGKYQRPDQQWYYDENTTATGTTDSGGAVLNTSGLTSGSYAIITSEIAPANNNLMNNTLHIYMRAGPGTAGGTIGTQIIIGGPTQYITVNLATIVLPASGKALYYLGSINVGQLGPFSGLVYALYGTAATSTNISVDFVMAIAGDAAMIDLSYGAGALETDGEFEVIGDSVRGYKSLTGLYGSFGSLIGVPIDLMPDKTNILICEGARGSNILSLGDTLTFTIDVTPRWSVL